VLAQSSFKPLAAKTWLEGERIELNQLTDNHKILGGHLSLQHFGVMAQEGGKRLGNARI
jgi:hypothetical protein